jgi:hypothetical protein
MGYATDTIAGVQRAQWEDYKRNYIPDEDELIAAYNNPQLKEERLAASTQIAATSADTAREVAARGLSRYGQTMDSAGDARAAQLTKSAAMVDAQNVNRQMMNERDKLLLSGGLTSLGV